MPVAVSQSIPRMSESNNRVTSGSTATRTRFLNSAHFSDIDAVASAVADRRPSVSSMLSARSVRATFPSRMADTIRCAPSDPNASVAMLSASDAELALRIAASVAARASCGSLPASAVRRKNALRAGPTRVRSTPAACRSPMTEAVWVIENPAFWNTGPNVCIRFSSFSPPMLVSWVTLKNASRAAADSSALAPKMEAICPIASVLRAASPPARREKSRSCVVRPDSSSPVAPNRVFAVPIAAATVPMSSGTWPSAALKSL